MQLVKTKEGMVARVIHEYQDSQLGHMVDLAIGNTIMSRGVPATACEFLVEGTYRYPSRFYSAKDEAEEVATQIRRKSMNKRRR